MTPPGIKSFPLLRLGGEGWQEVGRVTCDTPQAQVRVVVGSTPEVFDLWVVCEDLAGERSHGRMMGGYIPRFGARPGWNELVGISLGAL